MCCPAGSDACPGYQPDYAGRSITTSQSVTVEFRQSWPGKFCAILSGFSNQVNGKYVFTGLQGQKTYRIVPERNNDFTNGISTLDILEIQKHLLGVKPLVGPHSLIAATSTEIRKLSAVDLVQLRK